eukprot:TRINITY_DN6197_c0_g1_i1.p1 TRINITY_DN6197_c0_g1~~TRINITY_DN6197_c0_g1_i1.p1  ORF type:complete len:154 (-),score=22.61 TRINITY_DN6197_c0_g1_i1:77-538(-)
MTWNFFLLISRQGKLRLSKWYGVYSEKDKSRIVREVGNMCINRHTKLCNFLEWKDYKIVYKRYASLYFIACVDKDDNELISLETIHHYVECLDRYFGNVCELDLIFNFYKAYFILEEIIAAGELQETSKNSILRVIGQQDIMFENPSDLKHEI